MFKKLISNLPFNPSLIGQVSFYAKRLHQETAIRRMGFIFVLITLFIQIFAVISPPEPTLAESSNDILQGGFTTQTQAVNACRNNTQDFANILNYYRVSCDALAGAATRWIKSTDYDKQLDSLGRNQQGPVIPRTGKPTDEYRVPINGTFYYMKNLWAWDSHAYSSYKVLDVKNRDGTTIMIMYSCGNIITIGVYTPPAPPAPTPSAPPQPIDACPAREGFQNTVDECDVCPNIPGTQNSSIECYPCPRSSK